MIPTPGAMPAMPRALFAWAAIVPVTWVPWPWSSAAPAAPVIAFHGLTNAMPARSSWLAVVPVSRIATITDAEPVVICQAVGTPISGRSGWLDEYRGSFGLPEAGHASRVTRASGMTAATSGSARSWAASAPAEPGRATTSERAPPRPPTVEAEEIRASARSAGRPGFQKTMSRPPGAATSAARTACTPLPAAAPAVSSEATSGTTRSRARRGRIERVIVGCAHPRRRRSRGPPSGSPACRSSALGRPSCSDRSGARLCRAITRSSVTGERSARRSVAPRGAAPRGGVRRCPAPAQRAICRTHLEGG